jgi:hypothetical protein
MAEIYPRLWVSQVPNFTVAYHRQGTFKEENIQIADVRDEVLNWQGENQESLDQLHLLLNLIIRFTETANVTGQLEIRRPGPDTIEIRERATDGNHVLPSELLHRWTTGAEHVDEESRFGGGLYGGDDGYCSRSDSDAELDKDYTACSAEGCGYCGRCTY